MYHMYMFLNVPGPIPTPIICKTLGECKKQFSIALKASSCIEPRNSIAHVGGRGKRSRDYVLKVGPRGGVQVIRTSA